MRLSPARARRRPLKKPGSPLTAASPHAQGGQPAEPKKKPGKQPGAKGFGRTQKFAATGERMHRAVACTACGDPLAPDAASQAYAAWDEIDTEVLPAAFG